MSFCDPTTFNMFDKFLLSQKGKIIHQIWFGTIPSKRQAKKQYEKLQYCRNSWASCNPSWNIVEWNKYMCTTLITTFYKKHLKMFKNYKYEIQRCDMVRYLILHRYGGWYADMDYYCNKPLDNAMEIYTNDLYFVQSPNNILTQNDDHISNSLMYSIPNNNFWRIVMLELEKTQKCYSFYTKHMEVMSTTGPGVLNRIYSKYKHKHRIKSLPHKLFHPYGINDNILKSFKLGSKIYTAHMSKGSWEQIDSKIYLYLYREWKILLFILITMITPNLIYHFLFNKLTR